MKIKKILLLVLIVVAVFVFAAVLAHAVFYSANNEITAPTGTASAVSAGEYPIHLVIPAIKVDAKVQKVGITGGGKMAVPTNYTNVGWYQYGTTPGLKGSAVIDGHVDDGLAFPGVFVNLDQLKAGDDIYVTMNTGTTLHFVMTGSRAYDKNDANTGSIFNDNSGQFLRLITCTGSWLPLERTHDQRLVVTALLVK